MTRDEAQTARVENPSEWSQNRAALARRIRAWRESGFRIMAHSLASAIIERLEHLEAERARGLELLRPLLADLEQSQQQTQKIEARLQSLTESIRQGITEETPGLLRIERIYFRRTDGELEALEL